MKKAIVLLSGGIDSATALAIAKYEGFDVYAMSFSYGQRHAYELQCAHRIANRNKVLDHIEISFDLRIIGGSALTDAIGVPEGRSMEEMSSGIPATYVPARNTIFLSFALSWADVLKAHDVYVGMNAADYAGYPDCRPEYVALYEAMTKLATKTNVESGEGLRIHTPLIHMQKVDIIRRGLELGVDYSLTSSCYQPSPMGLACGKCDACRIRLDAFASLNQADPIAYVR